VLPLLPFDLRGAKLYLPGAVASLGERAGAAAELEREVVEAGIRATKVADDELVRFLETQGRLVRLGPEHAIGSDAYGAARMALIEECRSAGEITLARFRDLLGIGRRDAQLLLERFDGDGITRRVGDRRVLRRAATEPTSRPSW
jgi:selenocysteine-specific elongation factor